MVTIILLGMLLFNWCGYRLLNAYLEGRANHLLQSRLDHHHYEESDLISVKVSAHKHLLAYDHSSAEFVRADGQIEIDGLKYNFVKRRLYNDSIEMLCIKNQDAIHLNKAKNDFFSLVNDLQHTRSENKSPSHSIKSFSDEYCRVHHPFILENGLQIRQQTFFLYSAVLPVMTSPTDDRPPQRTA